jgi:hypothetical protein
MKKIWEINVLKRYYVSRDFTIEADNEEDAIIAAEKMMEEEEFTMDDLYVEDLDCDTISLEVDSGHED